MRNKKVIIVVILVIIGLTAFSLFRKSHKSNNEIVKEMKPQIGNIESVISTTGTVLPKNRLEVKPPVNGRVDSILVSEGQKIKAGQILAWMSSTERAALIDAARSQGPETLKYWEEAYKAIQLISPIDGEVIVGKTQPGQTVTTSDAVVVLSDQLIVRAQVDETDIGKVKEGQSATIYLDAYPDEKIKAKVEHIYYESKTVNNVTIYEVDLVPERIPDFFRSGMNATINFVKESKENILLIPLEAVHKDKDEIFVLLKKEGELEPVKQIVKLGISDDKNAEIISGVNAENIIIVKSEKYALPKGSSGSNPFMPFGRRRAQPAH